MKKYLSLFFTSAILGFLVLLVLFVNTPKANAWHNYWVYGDWSQCKVSKDQPVCGVVEGTQHRTATCTNLDYPYPSNCDKVGEKTKQTQSCEVNLGECEVTPTPTETPQPSCTENCGNPPTFQGSTTEAPVCPDGNTSQPVANPQVVRNGTQATVSFFITEGDGANIYWKVSGSADWQNAVSDVKGNSDKFVTFTINDLQKGVDYDFGFQQIQGCGGGQIVTAVVHDGYQPATFGLSYYIW